MATDRPVLSLRPVQHRPPRRHTLPMRRLVAVWPHPLTNGSALLQHPRQGTIASCRPGRPPIHSQEVRGSLISLALQKPRSLGYPFELWTLERLQTAFRERHDTHLSDSTIWTWMDEEGFKWKRQQSWFHDAERHDPEFVEKRGA